MSRSIVYCIISVYICEYIMRFTSTHHDFYEITYHVEFIHTDYVTILISWWIHDLFQYAFWQLFFALLQREQVITFPDLAVRFCWNGSSQWSQHVVWLYYGPTSVLLFKKYDYNCWNMLHVLMYICLSWLACLGECLRFSSLWGHRIHHQLARIEIDPKASHSTMTYYDYNLKNTEETHVAFVFLRSTIWFERFWVNHELAKLYSIHHANRKDTSRQLRPGGSPIMVRAAIWWPVSTQVHVLYNLYFWFVQLLQVASPGILISMNYEVGNIEPNNIKQRHTIEITLGASAVYGATSWGLRHRKLIRMRMTLPSID